MAIIYIDVDDTLIRTSGTKQIPISGPIEFVRHMHAAGHTLFLWSRGGAEYSRLVAESLGIEDCFVAFLPKPDILLDDRLEKALSHCQLIHPNQVASGRLPGGKAADR